MTGPARVSSIDALAQFKAALAVFADEVDRALSEVQQELHRLRYWLESDQPQYWRIQLQRGFDRVAQARMQLSTCKMRTVAGRTPACIEEQLALRTAKHRLQFTQDQAEVVRRWSIKVQHEADEYRGRISALEECLARDVPRAMAILDRMLRALEAYTEQTLEQPDDANTEECSPQNQGRPQSPQGHAGEGHGNE